ncbi:MAG: zinc-dependent metalloprotease [Actinomycetales bacterium]|nr:zinc-dependent metalloprotease [Actinomycetales bacterium]
MSDETPGTGQGGGEPDPLDDIMRMLQGFLGRPGGDPGSAQGVPMMLPEGLRDLPGMPSDPESLQRIVIQVHRMLSDTGDGPVNWDLARDIARQVAAAEGDPTVSAAEQHRVTEALRTADLWLDRVTDLPSVTARTEAWSRAEWIERTMDTWRTLIEPIAARVGDATAEAVAAQAPEEARQLLAGALPMMRTMGGAFFGAQVGQALGTLAREVVSGGDTGVPLLPSRHAALLPVNITAFGTGLGLPEDEIRLYLALREAAHARLVAGVPWLRSHLLSTVEEYARGISIDGDRIADAVRQLDPGSPEALQEAMSSGLFEPQRTPGQQAALDRLETALALVEGWIDEVVDAAARTALPHAAQLRETVRRRRAAGGPAEHTFAALVGLELRPRRLREAAAVWAAVADLHGVPGRDRLWTHPDLVPTEDAFTDPGAFAARVGSERGQDAMDAALAALLDEETADESPTGEDSTGEDSTDGNSTDGNLGDDRS